MKIKKITALISALAVSAGFAVPSTISFAAARELSVGPSGDYKTIHEAVAAAKALNPQSEAERVTINVMPGDYEEQVRIDGLSYITLQQMPDTTGKVNLSWYFCTGYCTSNTDLNGLYSQTIDWSRDETWNGYKEGDEKFTKYKIGQSLEGVSSISYYDTNGVAHKNEPVNSQLKNLGGLGWSYDKMAALIVTRSSSNITVKDFNVVNSVPVMKTQAEVNGHLTPEAGRTDLLDHSALSICGEDTEMVKPTADIFNGDGSVSRDKYVAYISGKEKPVFTPGESAWLLRSSLFNERGHAIATLGDKIIFENVRARGNQDSIWASDGRVYFKNCTLIGGTDYIYGSASAVFDSCKLGFAGFTDKSYGNPLATPNTDKSRKYGYLFWNCTVYNENTCAGGTSNFGGPWGDYGQATMYNTTIDDDGTISGNRGASIDAKGWTRFGAEQGKSRVYEYGTKNNSGNAVDLSGRVVNKSVEEGGYGMGTVLDKWQILEFNPRNYFSRVNDSTWSEDWDPMNFGTTHLAKIDTEIAASTITVPAGEDTVINLPKPSDSNIEFHWVSASTNAVVSDDGTKLTVARPAVGEPAITTTVTLYARNKTTGFGDKREIPVTIEPTTDTTNVFNIPVTINQSHADNNDYTVTISKDGALIKRQVISVSDKTASALIEAVPASASGIKYDVAVVSSSDLYTVTAPEDGKTTITGITGNAAALEITAAKIVDETVSLNTTVSSAGGNKKLDLIALAKAAGATDDITTSESIKVSYTLDVTPETSGNSFIDLVSGTPADSLNQNAVTNRFVLAKLGHWNQLDLVDSSQKYGGSSDGPGQCLNLCGKFTSGIPSNVEVTIDYKNRSISVSGSGSGSKSYTFANFPTSYTCGVLSMGVYVGTETFTVRDIKVTYKKLADIGDPTPLPPGNGTYTFPSKNITNGNACTNSDTFSFVTGVDESVKAVLADKSDPTKMDQTLVEGYKNYVGGTGSNATHPSISLEAPAGIYRLYFVGYNHGNNVTATVGGKTFTAEAGINLAAKDSNRSYVLKYYTIDIEFPGSGESIVFDSSDQWLPDLYCIAVVGLTAQKAELVSASDSLTGENAAAYAAEFSNYTGKLNTLSWKIEKADGSASKTTPKEAFGTATDVTNTTVVVGLVITTQEKLDTIGTVTAILN